MTDARTTTHAAWDELAAFGVLVALGGAVFASSFSYGILLEENRVGPGFLPMLLGLLLVLLSGSQLVAALRSSRPQPVSVIETFAGSADAAPESSATSAPQDDEPGVDVLGRSHAFRVRQMRIVVAATFVTLLLVPYAGFLLAFGVLVLFIATVVEGRSWLSAVAITGAAVGIVYGVFGVFLNVPLPAGLLTTLTGG